VGEAARCGTHGRDCNSCVNIFQVMTHRSFYILRETPGKSLR
jgi:hypothetical protein